MCIGSNDNYLDMLTEQVGFEQALEYVKVCALSDMSSDVRLIEKMYYSNQQQTCSFPPIDFMDQKRGKLSFYDQNKQNTYLKGVPTNSEKNMIFNYGTVIFMNDQIGMGKSSNFASGQSEGCQGKFDLHFFLSPGPSFYRGAWRVTDYR